MLHLFAYTHTIFTQFKQKRPLVTIKSLKLKSKTNNGKAECFITYYLNKVAHSSILFQARSLTTLMEKRSVIETNAGV